MKVFALPLEPRGCLLLARLEAGNAEGGLKGQITDGSNPSNIVLGENHFPRHEDQESLRAARAGCKAPQASAAGFLADFPCSAFTFSARRCG